MSRPSTSPLTSPDVHLTLCLTHDCNLRCRYCYGGEKTARHMELATGLRALDLALERTSERLHLIFFGGEPLLRWSTLVELTAEARQRAANAGVELQLAVTTNGTRLDSERAGWLADHEAIVALSSDGTVAAHDINRCDGRGNGSQARTMAGLEQALAAGLRVRTVLVVDPSNVAALPDSAEYLAARGADDMVVNINWAAQWVGEEIEAAWTTAYEELSRRYVAAYRQGQPFWISVIDDKIATHIRGGFRAHELCDMGRRDLIVAPSGNLYPCDRLVGEDRDDATGAFVIGHVDTGPDPKRLASVVGGACRPPPDCSECSVRTSCRNRCGCANLAMTGSLDSPSAVLCFHEQLAIRCADAAAETLVAEKNAAFLKKHYGAV